MRGAGLNALKAPARSISKRRRGGATRRGRRRQTRRFPLSRALALRIAEQVVGFAALGVAAVGVLGLAAQDGRPWLAVVALAAVTGASAGLAVALDRLRRRARPAGRVLLGAAALCALAALLRYLPPGEALR